ncbi:MAG: branched-chain amino acid ABC transporter permease [Dichotomicrobium sp.]
MAILIEQIINGVIVGAYFTLLALGLSLIFSLGGIVNLAHGAFYAIGAYIAVELDRQLGYPLAFAISPVVTALIGMAIEVVFLRRLVARDPVLTLLFTFGVAIIIEEGLRLVWGATGIPFSIPEMFRGILVVGDFLVTYYRLAILAAVVVAVALVWLLLNRTDFGLIVKAGTSDPEIVRSLGINLRPIQTTVFGIGIALAAIAGVVSAPLAGVHPAMGTEVVTAAFVIVVIGGLGSFWGTLLAGVLVGVVRGVTITVLPPAADASMYALMVLVLLLRPRGLLGEEMEKLEQ